MDAAASNARHLIDAVNEALETPTAYRDETPLPAYGTTPPVAQPGRPPMSQKATDDSARMLSAGFLTLCAGGAVSGVLYCSGQADPTVIGLMAAAPLGLAVPILALSRLVKRAKPAGDVHHHYNGNVDQRTVNTDARGVFAKNQVKGTR